MEKDDEILLAADVERAVTGIVADNLE